MRVRVCVAVVFYISKVNNLALTHSFLTFGVLLGRPLCMSMLSSHITKQFKVERKKHSNPEIRKLAAVLEKEILIVERSVDILKW